MSSIKVAVRVRPFNSREKDRNAELIVKMAGKSTVLYRPNSQKTGNAAEDEKNFSYDFSYWSFDQSDHHFASQKTVFDDLGVEVLKNAWEGFNTSIFAYGQTGAGKSYSMLGYGEDKGIIPLACEEIFRRIQRNADPSISFKVEVSFMEIYNEKVKDLLNPKNNKVGGLKVRNHPTTGPYVEDLAKLAVKSFHEVETLMDEGSKARTVASTDMNATSSRSHAVFSLVFTQSNAGGAGQAPTERASKIHLVDLAGSERATSTGATGVRLKEGANINKSLSTLGKVISALADNSTGKKQVFVPYRDSVLTWLLKESLGGNAKTIMIAAISPADINYDETLSTLRYADSAKKIKNSAIVNEDPKSKLIRELQQEVEMLRKKLLDSGSDPNSFIPRPPAEDEGGENEGDGERDEHGAPDELVTSLRDQLEQSEKLIAEMNKSWEERLNDAQRVREERVAALKDMGVAIKAVAWLPHLVNLNEDPLMSGSLIYYLREGSTRVGRSVIAGEADSADKAPPDIVLNGLNITHEHCTFVCERETPSQEVVDDDEDDDDDINHKPLLKVTVVPPPLDPNNQHSYIYVNGVEISMPFLLTHGNRVILGNNHVFRFNHPFEAARIAAELAQKGEHKDEVIDWDFALKELAAAQGKLMISRVHFDEKEQELEQKMREILEERARQLSQPAPRGNNDLSASGMFIEMDEKIRKPVTLAARRWVERVSRKRLERQITQMSLPINEANAISVALGRNVVFELRLYASFPAHVAENQLDPISLALGGWRRTQLGVRMRSSPTHFLYSSPTPVVSALLSQEDFLDRFAVMREMYQTAGYATSSALLQYDPFDIPVQPHILVGVGRLYLRTLLYLLDKKYHLPLIAADGTPRGQLSVELSPLNKGNGRRGADGEPLAEELVSKRLEFELKITTLLGLNPSEYKDVFCKFVFAGVLYETGSFTNPADMSYSAQIIVDKVDDNMLEFLQTGAITIELYGIPHLTAPQDEVGEQQQEENEDSSHHTLEFIAAVDIMEMHEPEEVVHENNNGDHHENGETNNKPTFVSVPSVETEGGDVVFRLHEDCPIKRLVFHIVRAYPSSTSIVECKSIYVGNVRPTARKAAKISHAPLSSTTVQNSPFVPPPPASLMRDWLPLNIVSVATDTVVADWNVQKHSMHAFQKRTAKGERVVFGFVAELVLDDHAKPLLVGKDITAKILPSPAFSHGRVLERLRSVHDLNIAQPTNNSVSPPNPNTNGAPFRVVVRKTRPTSQFSRIIAMIDHHRQGLIKFGNALQMERLKQELDLREKLAVTMHHNDNSDNSNNSEEVDGDPLTQELAKRISIMEMNNASMHSGLPRKRSENNLKDMMMTEVQVENVAASAVRQQDRAGWLRKRSNYKDTWKKRWFVLRRPFLEYFDNSSETITPPHSHRGGSLGSSERQRIDLTNCSITVLNNEETNGDVGDVNHSGMGYMFVIMHGARAWVLSASSEDERAAWLGALDPARVVAASLQEKLKSAQNDSLKTKSLVEVLQTQLQLREEKVRELDDEVSKLGKEVVDRAQLLSVTEQELHTLKATHFDALLAKEALHNQVVSLNEAVKQSHAYLEKAQTELTDKDANIKVLNEELDIVNQLLEGKTQELDLIKEQSEQEVQALTANIKEITEKSEQEAEALKNNIKEIKEKSEQEIQALTENIKDLQEKNEQEVQELQDNMEEMERKNELEVQVLRENIEEIQNECNARDSELDELRAKVHEQQAQLVTTSQKAEFVISNMTLKLNMLQNEVAAKMMQIQNLSSTVGMSTKIMESTTAHLQNLVQQIDGLKGDLVVKDETINIVTEEKEETQQQLHHVKRTKEELEAEWAKSREEASKLKQQLVEMTAKFDNSVFEVHQATEGLADQTSRVKELEDQVKLKDSKLQLLDEHLQRVRDEYTTVVETSKSQLLKSTSSGLFSKKPSLEAYKEASVAHQTHNAFLHLELKRLDNEKHNLEKVYLQTIARIKSDLQTRNQQYTELLRNAVGPDAGAMIKDMTDTIDALKKKYFVSLAVGGKLQRCLSGERCNIDAFELYERATEQHVLDFEQWPTWIAEQLATITE